MSSDRGENRGFMRHEKRVRERCLDILMQSINHSIPMMRRCTLSLMVEKSDCRARSLSHRFVS